MDGRGPAMTVPHRKPNMDTVAPASMKVWAEGPATSVAAEAARSEATAAAAPSALTTLSAPVRNPASGPRAASTYAYGPPLADTRLPASAKHNTMSAMTAAQTR